MSPAHRVAPAPEAEVRALAALRQFAPARERFRELGLTPLVFTHPFARWMSARALVEAELPVDQLSLLDKRVDGKYSWNESIEWLQPHDAATAVWAIGRLAQFAAPHFLPDELIFAADRIRAGAEPASACRRFLALLRSMEEQKP